MKSATILLLLVALGVFLTGESSAMGPDPDDGHTHRLTKAEFDETEDTERKPFRPYEMPDDGNAGRLPTPGEIESPYEDTNNVYRPDDSDDSLPHNTFVPST